MTPDYQSTKATKRDVFHWNSSLSNISSLFVISQDNWNGNTKEEVEFIRMEL